MKDTAICFKLACVYVLLSAVLCGSLLELLKYLQLKVSML